MPVLHYALMPPHWNASTHLQAVQFDHEREPKMREVRQCSLSLAAGELVRVGVSGVEVEALVVANAPGLLTRREADTPEGGTDEQGMRKRRAWPAVSSERHHRPLRATRRRRLLQGRPVRPSPPSDGALKTVRGDTAGRCYCLRTPAPSCRGAREQAERPLCRRYCQ
jgi:hypothetical protein